MATPEIIDLPTEPEVSVTDDDLLLIYEIGASADRSKQVTRGRLLHDVARDGGDHDFGTSEITDLTASTASVNNLTVTTGLIFDTGATIDNVYAGLREIVLPDVLTESSNTQTVAFPLATTGNFLIAALKEALPDGLTMQAWISSADVVSFKFYNSTGLTISGATYNAKIMVVQAS